MSVRFKSGFLSDRLKNGSISERCMSGSMSDRSKRGSMHYLPRYQPVSSAVVVPHRRRRYSYPGTTSSSREFTYYIEGRPARVINSYPSPDTESCTKASRIFLCSPSLDYYLTRVTGNTSFHDANTSHVYTSPGRTADVTIRHREEDNVEDVCQDIFDRSSCLLDMTPSESGVSVGESEDWSVFGHEVDSISQRSSNSWSTFCEVNGDNDDLDRNDIDNFNSPSLHGDEQNAFHYNNNDNYNFVNLKNPLPSEDLQIPESTFNIYSHNGYIRETPTNVCPSWHTENAENQLTDFLGCASNFESHPGILSESLKYSNGQTTEQTIAHDSRSVCRPDWQSVSRDSVVCDTSCSSEWCSFAQFGKLDNCKYHTKTRKDIVKHETQCEDVCCDNGFSEDDNSEVIDSTVSSGFGDMEVTRTPGNMKVTETHGNMEVTRTHGETEVTKTHDVIILTRTYSDNEMTRQRGGIELTRTGGNKEMTETLHSNMTRCYSCANLSAISSEDNKDNIVNGQGGPQWGTSCTGTSCTGITSTGTSCTGITSTGTTFTGTTLTGTTSTETSCTGTTFTGTTLTGTTSTGTSFTGTTSTGTTFTMTTFTGTTSTGTSCTGITCTGTTSTGTTSTGTTSTGTTFTGTTSSGTTFTGTNSTGTPSTGATFTGTTSSICFNSVHEVQEVRNEKSVPEVQTGEDVYITEVWDSTNVYDATYRVKGETVDSVEDGVKENSDVYDMTEGTQEVTCVYNMTAKLQEGTVLYSGEVINKRNLLLNDICTRSFKQEAADGYLTTVSNRAKEQISMFFNHQLSPSGETLREVDTQLDARHEITSSEMFREYQILDKIGHVLTRDVTEEEKHNKQTYLQTNRLHNREDDGIKDSMKLYHSQISQTVQPTNKKDILANDSSILWGNSDNFRDYSPSENYLPYTSDMGDDDDGGLSAPVSFRNLLLSFEQVVDTCLVRNNSTTEDANSGKYTGLNRGESFEDISDIDSNNADFFFRTEIVTREDVNRWDLPEIREQRSDNIPASRFIDSVSESSNVKAEQTQLKQSSVRHQDSTVVDRGNYNNNTSAENLIDSSLADTQRLPCPSEFWKETQSSEEVLGKAESIENKYTDIGINADNCRAQLGKQRLARVAQQLNNQFVISFDSCDTSGRLYLCIYCGKRTQTNQYGQVCAHCVFLLCNNSLGDDVKVINNCYGREDIDSCAGIPVSILDESIKHAREKLRRNKGIKHVGHFCAVTQGVGSGKIDEIIPHSRLEEQEVRKSIIRHGKDSRAVDCHNTAVTERVDISLLSIFGSDADNSSDKVLFQVSNKLDTAPRVSDSCQDDSWNNLFVGLVSQDAVSIDKTSADTFSSTRFLSVPSATLSVYLQPSTRLLDVPADFINLPSSSDIRLGIDEHLSSVAPVCHASLASSIVSRDTTSNIQTMKETRSNLDMNVSTPCVGLYADTSRSRENSSPHTGLFTSGCHVNALDDLHAQLSFITGNNGSAESEDFGYTATDVYRDRARATCSWKFGSVADAGNFFNTPVDHSVQQTFLNHTNSKAHINTVSNSRKWMESPPAESNSFVLSDTKEEYDNDDTYATSETHRGSRLLPRSYNQMPLFRYGLAKVSSLWTVPEEPENICDEACTHSSSTMYIEEFAVRNSRSNLTTFTSRKNYTADQNSALMECNSVINTGSKKCTLRCGSTISMGENKEVLDTEDKSKHLFTSSESALSSLVDENCISFNQKSNRAYNRPVEDSGSMECGQEKMKICDKFLVCVDKNSSDLCSVHHPLDPPRQGSRGSSAGDQGRRDYLYSDGICHDKYIVGEVESQERNVDNLSVLDTLSQSLSQFSRQGADLVCDRKSLFREDTTDFDEETQECYSSSHTLHGKHMDESGVSGLLYSDSYISDSNTSSDSIKHISFSSTGKAEFKDTAIDDYDNPPCPRSVLIRSDQMKQQTDLNEMGRYGDISVRDFEKIVEELNISMSRIQEIAETMLPQNKSNTACEDLYQEFTNEEAEKQQNHGCIVHEHEDAVKYRFKRFLKKSHNKRKRGLKILKFFSRLGCVSGMSSPITSRKLTNNRDKFLNAETQLLPEQTVSNPVLVSSTGCHDHEIHSLSSVRNGSSPSSSNQSLDSVPSKTDSAYSSFSESTEVAVNNLVSLSMSNSQVPDSLYHPTESTNMDSSIVSCSSLDFSSSSSDLVVIHASSIDSANIHTPALMQGALTSTDIMSDVFDELSNCEDEIDIALLNNMRYGHTPVKIDKIWG